MTELSTDEDYVAGESLDRVLTINDPETDEPMDLTGVSAEWYLVPSKGADDADAILSDADAGVTINVDSVADEITLTIERDITNDLAGRSLWHRFVVDDQTTGRQIFRGEFPIQEP